MGYKPTEAIVNNSLKGLALLEKNTSLKAKSKQQELQPVSKSLQGELELHEVHSLYFRLLKAKEKYNPKQLLEGYNVTPDTASFLALGGNAALAWASAIVNKSTEDKTKVDTEDDIPGIPLQVTKAVNTDLMQATFVVMVPDEVDLHGDITSVEDVRKACHNFNKFCRKSSLFHLVETDTFDIAESWISPVDFSLGGKFVKKGTWLCTVQVHDDDLWQLIKKGDICSVSIGAMAKVQKIEDEDNE